MNNSIEKDNTIFAKVEEVEVEETEEEKARIENFIERFDKLLKIYEEKMIEEFKLDIWNAHVRNEIICLQMKDDNIFVGKSRFPMNINYTSVDQLQQLFYFDFKLANGVTFDYHIGGDYVSIFTSNIKQVFVMTPTEIDDANQYANMAPIFIKRLLPSLI